jgi:hypothetical protein
MAPPRRRLSAIVGAGVLVAAAAGLTAVAPAAQADAVEYEVSCQPPPAGGRTFTWKPKVELSVSAPKQDTYKVGEEVTVTWHWVAPPRNPWAIWPILPNVESPSGTVRLSGAQVGDLTVAGPAKHPGADGAKPLAVSDMTGRFTIAAEGRIDLALGGYELRQPAIAVSGCVPVQPDRLPVAAGITIGAPVKPGEGSTSAPGGGGSIPGSTPKTPTSTSTPARTPIPGGSSAPPIDPTTNPTAGADSSPGAPSTASSTPSISGTPAVPPVPPASTPPTTVQAPPADAPAGSLFMQQNEAGATMSGFTPATAAQRLEGQLHPVSIKDGRGSNLGWTLTGQASDFVGQGGEVVPAQRLTWQPACAIVDGPPAAVRSGLPGSIGGDAAVLCRQDPSSGDATGGAFQANAALSLELPGGGRSDTYTGNLTLSLS